MKFAVVDIECTGGSFGSEKMIDIAIFILEDGEVVDQLVSLVNPEKSIDPYVTKLTGITNKMVRTAPKFYELAKRVIKITQDCTFVAHNISFDYRVFQQEFDALGFDFHRATLDTIPYAERIFPDWENYGLKTVSKELGLINTARHRAEGDARLTLDLLKVLFEKDRASVFSEVQVSREASVHKNPFKEQVRELDNKVGIYYIFNAADEIIYIGSSKDLQNSINRHFVADNKVALALQKEAVRLEIEDIGNEAIAEILFHKTVEFHRPIYNAVKKKKLLNYGIFPEPRKSHMIEFVKVFPVRYQLPPFYFDSPKSLYPWLQRLMMEHKLNPATFLLDKDRGHYEKNVQPLQWKPEQQSVALSDMRKAMLPEEAIMVGPGRKGQEKCAIIVEGGRVLGYTYFYLSTDGLNRAQLKKRMVDLDSDAYTIGVIGHFYRKGYLKR